jgi:uncharacterized protein (TIGR02145 family)
MRIHNRTLRPSLLAPALCLAAAWLWLPGCGDNSAPVTYGALRDDRDGKEYKTVRIGGQTWMAENLNYRSLRGKSWCYDDDSSNCDKYGRLYDWETAMMVCPEGWHLPSAKEWKTLVEYVGRSDAAGKKRVLLRRKKWQTSVAYNNGVEDTVGQMLKSASGWHDDGDRYYGNNATDDYGFSALPGGYRYFNYKKDYYYSDEDDGVSHGFGGIGKSGAWWTATKDRWRGGSNAYRRGMYSYVESVDETGYAKSYGFSARCVMDNGNSGGNQPVPAQKTAPADFTDSAAGVDMVFVKGEMFLMGCAYEQKGCGENEKRRRLFNIGDFYIGKYEVTQKQWSSVMGNNPSKGDKEENLPVSNVSWNDVQEFIKRLNALTGGAYRLPLETEWEYAARGGAKGERRVFAGSDSVDSVAWHGGNSGGKAHPVGTKAPNELGIYDMGGNAWEWTGSLYEKDTYSNYFWFFDPVAFDTVPGRVVRGGNWLLDAWFCRVSARYRYNPDSRFDHVGFRLAAPAHRPAFDTLIDARDGKAYKTVKIGGNTWMAENLNYQPRNGKSWCYRRDTSYCKEYGRLYDWNTASDACPAGWHLPSYSEWENLIEYAGGANVAGKKLKAESGWDDEGGVSGNGYDVYGFSALPGGARTLDNSQRFKLAGGYGYWWTASENDSVFRREVCYCDDEDLFWSNYAINWGMCSYDSEVFRDYSKKDIGYSVRCVKDSGNKPASAQQTEPPDTAGGMSEIEREMLAGNRDGKRYKAVRTPGGLRDARDGKKYNTVKIGSITWMAENLNYETGNSVCYDNDSSYCKKYGRLYDWDDAVNACPAGWHLPSRVEWNYLGYAVGGKREFDDDVGYDRVLWHGAGKKLKSVKNWYERYDYGKSDGETDEYGFSALPGGHYSTSYLNKFFADLDIEGTWWTSAAAEDTGYAYARWMIYKSGTLSEHLYNKRYKYKHSVRCVKDGKLLPSQ